MKTYTKTSDGILQQIGSIERMEPGKLCIIGQGKEGPFYNLQCRENGKPVSRYVSRDQLEEVKENTKNYRRFQKLVDQYAQEIIAQTREKRFEGKKKGERNSSGSRKKNSKG
jgi:hypothetical protein